MKSRAFLLAVIVCVATVLIGGASRMGHLSLAAGNLRPRQAGPSSGAGNPPLVASSPLDDSAIDGARRFAAGRRAAYEGSGLGRNWRMRGVGYLHEQRGVLLAGALRRPSDERGRHVFEIHNVHPNQSTDAQLDCHLLTIWVRISGPEIFAGSARTVQGGDGDASCHWEFSFDVAVAGQYSVDSKVLLWNGRAPVNGTQCPVIRGDPNPSVAPVHAGFKGFKLYHPEVSCCEVCSRLSPHCKHWATPAFALLKPSYLNNGCELWFDDDVPPDVVPVSRLIGPNRTVDDPAAGRRRLREAAHAHGPPHDGETVYHLGCGWNFWFALEYPCLSGDLDDRVYVAEPLLNFTLGEVRSGRLRRRRVAGVQPRQLQASRGNRRRRRDAARSRVPPPPDQALQGGRRPPLHRERPQGLGGEHLLRPGVGRGGHAPRHQGPRRDERPQHQGGVVPSTETAEIDRPLCQSDGTGERGRWVREPWPDGTACPEPFSFDEQFQSRFGIAKFDGTRPHCWHRDDLTEVGLSCIEPNCRFLTEESKWFSPLREKDWFGVWRRYDCDYVEYTDAQLQQCVDALRVVEFEKSGHSIAEYLNEYVQLRTKNLVLADAEKAGSSGVTVKFDTLSLLHKARDSNDEIIQDVWSLPDVTANVRHFFITGFYLSSEREPLTHVDRMAELNGLLAPVAIGKGIEIVNVHDLSAAFTYDTATQFDGMHIIGPPMKMAITKMFHYLCKDVVEGSPL